MQMINKNILIALAAVTFTGMVFFIVLGALKVYLPRTDSIASTQTVATNNPAGQSQDPLTVQLVNTTPNQSVAYDEEIALQVHVKNNSDEDMSYGFSSGCTYPDLYFDGKNIDPVKLCTSAFTSVDIRAQETWTSDHSYLLIGKNSAEHNRTLPYVDDDGQLRIAPGTYNVTAEWQDVASEPLQVTIVE